MIHRVAIAGLGAVGAIYAEKIDTFLGNEHTYILVDEQRKQRYQTEGVYLNGRERQFNCVSTDQLGSPVDLLIIATKNNHLEGLIPSLERAIGPETKIISLLNGIDSEMVLAEAFPEAHILYAFATAIDSTREGNRIDYSSEGIIFFGEKDNAKSEEVRQIGAFFDACGIRYDNPEDIHTQMWAKYMVNVSINTVSAVCRATYGPCVTVPPIWDLIEAVMHEVIALARASGIRGLDESFITHYRNIFSTLAAEGKTSMLQDVEAKRVSENRWFCVRAALMGKELSIPTPNIAMLARVMEAIDAMHAEAKAP